MIQAILLALAAIPKLVDSVNGLVGALNKYQDAKWREELNAISSKLQEHASPEDKAKAARDLSALIAKL